MWVLVIERSVGRKTVSVAVAVLPVPPLLEVTWTELFLTPKVVAVTSTLIVHEAPAGRAPFEALIVELPAVARTVIVPAVQLPVRFVGLLTTTPEGRVSV